jgi:stage V sporulation protein R
MVINANPAYAFLLDTNTPLEDVFVMAHVMGHVDFFAQNQCFRSTPPDMLDQVAHHAERIRQYQFDHGADNVEKLLDAALALAEHVDWPTSVPPGTSRPVQESSRAGPGDTYADLDPRPDPRQRTKGVIPTAKPDVLGFLAEHAPDLEPWQRDVVSMVRSEMQYFWPQIRTKIMNEGWATYWHARLMRVLDLTDAEAVDFARLHASVLQPGHLALNPYLLGYRVFERLAESEGMEAIWIAREVDDDVSFIRNYLTEDLVESLDLYTWGVRQDQVEVKSTSWQTVRQQLVQELTHGGIPVLHVEDGDFNRRRELYLIHRHEGQDLDIPYAERALRHVATLWGRPVHLETRLMDPQTGTSRRVVLSYDGKVNSKVTL